jgi:hypothetical protein
MTRRRARILAITAVTFVVLVVSAGATFLYLVERALHANDGPPHVFVLEGDRRLTDEQAIDFARQAMTLDGRMSAGTVLDTFGDGTTVNRGDDVSYYTVGWREPAKYQWFVKLHRTPGKVECVTYLGK